MRFFFRQKRKVQERHEPTEQQIPHVAECAGGEGAEAFAKRYRGFDFLIHIAELDPIIWSLFKRDYPDHPAADEYKLFHVLESMSYIRDRDRRQAHFSRAYAKVMEREARARRG